MVTGSTAGVGFRYTQDHRSAGNRHNFAATNAKSSQWTRASRSDFSTVAPVQIRSPGGASRNDPMSWATPSSSSNAVMALTNSACASGDSNRISGATIFRHTDVFDRVAGSIAPEILLL